MRLFETSGTCPLRPMCSAPPAPLTSSAVSTAESAAALPAEAAALSKEVEEEANSNFQRIYNHPPHPTLSIEEVLDMLRRYQDSSVPRERVRTAPGRTHALPSVPLRQA